MHVSCVVGGVDVVEMSVSEFNDRYPVAAEVWAVAVADLLDGQGGQRFRLTVWSVPAQGVAVVMSRPYGGDGVMSDRVVVAEVADVEAAFGFVSAVTYVQGVAVVGR